MNINNLFNKALKQEFLNQEEGLFLYEKVAVSDLMWLANELKTRILKESKNKVGWIIDRNVNITNVCIAQCKFCNFYRRPGDPDIYITSTEEYIEKIEVLKNFGGNQLLLQGGLHPKLGLKFYSDLFKELKKLYPDLKLHALGPAEIAHIARIEKISYREVLLSLIASGLDSLPGAGAEILTDRVRNIVSKGKCNSQQWLDVMYQAHKLNLTTSATMMFGHIETNAERIEHLIKIRDLQAKKPENSVGFISFIPWPFQDEGTNLNLELGIKNTIKAEEYIKTIALSRIMLPNITNIQASWLTVGKDVAKICLHAGANDFGSIMIEENVVSAAGANYQFDSNGIQEAIKEAGFEPYLRDQNYNKAKKPVNVEILG
ncbi:MAG: dehypoxanthine futalosine cyclase [Bacteroidales bacterium]|nr:dehypoxanthine futalosine cyclase [Bacteroidales bacterium]MBN2756905.1 dehypoxanthine futalosine cyclase [Bacteroidales bacterium]